MKLAFHVLSKLTRGFRQDLLAAFFALLAALCLIPIITYIYFAKDLVSAETIMNKNDAGLILFDRNNKPFFTFYNAKNKKIIPLSDIPDITKFAFIAMEDKDFNSNPGFSIKAILRSLFADVKERKLLYGGSTITQQLVKNSLLSPKKDFLRKFQEIVLAQEIDRRFSKDQILEMYLNSVYLGEGTFGIEEAANLYFNKAAKDLSLAESSILTAILPAPSRLSLINGDFNEAKQRQRLVLDKMVRQNYISRFEADEAFDKGVAIVPHPNGLNTIGIHFALMVKDQLVGKYGEENIARAGFKVKTTLDLDWQKYAEEVVAKQVDLMKVNRVTNGAALVIDPKTGEIRALVGSKDWYEPQFGKVNIVLSSRPPGSAFKPVIYARAFERQLITPATMLKDEPTSFANFDENKFYASFSTRQAAENFLKSEQNAYYKPKNYDDKFRGNVTVRRALSNSLNIPSVSVMKKVGVDDAVNFAQRLSLTTVNDPSKYGLSLVLGAAEVKMIELTNVYAMFANNGWINQPAAILEISDKFGNIIYQNNPTPQKVLDEKNAFLISSILSDNKSRSEVFGNSLTINRPAAVKTGTTEDFKDAWTIGYTPSLVVAVWVGNNFNQPMDGVAGSLGAAPIWRSLMEKFLEGTPVESFEPPSGIVKNTGCKDPRQRESTASGQIEYFVEGTQPITRCPALTVQTVTYEYYLIPGQQTSEQEILYILP